VTFWQAQVRARLLARGGPEGSPTDGAKPATVFEALNTYADDLRTRGGDLAGVARVRRHLPPTLGDQPVAMLTAKALRQWRDDLAERLAAGSVNRIGNALRAALNLAANIDERITSRRAWEIGLQALRDAVVARNVILPDTDIARVVAAAYAIGEAFGLLVEVAATTGARYGQIARIEVQDLQTDRARLMMPSSRKGKGQKKITRTPVPIPESLAVRLWHAAQHKAGSALLLTKQSGDPWHRSDHLRPFARAVRDAGLDPAVTIYGLRHSSIVRQLLAGVPIRVVAVGHDTSSVMVERTYSKHIANVSDDLTRAALVDFSAPPQSGDVLPLRR
jgi:integrase